MNQRVPYWKQLPESAQKDLSSRNYDETWFDKQEDSIRLTVLNLYVKLSGMNLWRYVFRRDTTSHGCLEFFTNNVRLLKQDLTNRWNFRSPEDSMDEWDSAEKRVTGALHLKHFKGWLENKVQAHIDQAGNWLGDQAFWWAGQPVTGLRHLASYDSYRDVFGIRNILLQQGWDRQPLLGVSIWHCGAHHCPTHNRPEHQCQIGVWYCGRRQPPCPGHSSPNHRCSTGRTWHCGARNCPTHSRPEHLCQTGVWYCGRTQPPCPGHSSRDHRCESGAASLYFDRMPSTAPMHASNKR